MRVNHHHCRVKKVAFLAFLWPSWGFKRPKYYICIVLYLIVFHGISRSSSFLWRTGKLSCSASSHLVQLGSFVLSFFCTIFAEISYSFCSAFSCPPSLRETYVNSWKTHHGDGDDDADDDMMVMTAFPMVQVKRNRPKFYGNISKLPIFFSPLWSQLVWRKKVGKTSC